MSVVGSYTLGDFLGRGGFGEVYKGTQSTTGIEVAVKLETLSALEDNDDMSLEAFVYEHVGGGLGIPRMYEHGRHEGQYYVAIDLLGPSLKKVFSAVDFSYGTIAIIAQRMITALEYVHNKGFVHGDVKPSNMLIGPEPNSVYLVDFGLAWPWNDVGVELNSGIEFEFSGSPEWASIAAHQGERPRRRDDLESLAYSLAYFCIGELPWHDQARFLDARNEEGHLAIECEKRKFIRNGMSLPDQLVTCLKYCSYSKRLPRLGNPDYDYLRCLFMDLIFSEGLDFDWTVDWAGIDLSDAESASGDWEVAYSGESMERNGLDEDEYSYTH